MADDGGQPGKVYHWILDLRGTGPTAVRRLRQWVATRLTGLDETHLANVLLVAEELGANAYDHGHGPRRIRLRYHSRPCRICVEVDDASPELPTLAPSTSSAPRGRGLMLVKALSERWGVQHHHDGKTVWAELNCGDAGSLFPAQA